MKQTIKWFIASLMVMVCLQVTAQPEGKYYLYNTYKAFLSRAANGNATIDRFGIPVEIKKGSTDGTYSMMFLDNGRYVAQSGTAVKGDQTSAAFATIKADGDKGIYTVELKDGTFLGIEGNDNTLGVSTDLTSSSFNRGWQLLTQAERDAIVAEAEVAQIEAVAKAAGITLAAEGDKVALFTEALTAYINIPSYQVKPGMVIALKESSRSIDRFKFNLENNAAHVIPRWLEFDAQNMIGKVVAAPTREDVDFQVEEHLIVELYSK